MFSWTDVSFVFACYWSRRCIPCAPGFYCPSKDQYVECPGTSIFKGAGGRYAVVPSTSFAAYKVQHCNCTSASGGFEPSPYSQALFGCVACEDGKFANPSSGRCQSCPMGKYASKILKSAVNYRVSPSADSPRISFYGLESSDGLATASATIDVGATLCTVCPADRPYTWNEGSKSVGDCRYGVAPPECLPFDSKSEGSFRRRCPQGQFLDRRTLGCRNCSASCAGPQLYEVKACTEDSDRQCSYCDFETCDPYVGEYVDVQRGCPGDLLFCFCSAGGRFI